MLHVDFTPETPVSAFGMIISSMAATYGPVVHVPHGDWKLRWSTTSAALCSSDVVIFDSVKQRFQFRRKFVSKIVESLVNMSRGYESQCRDHPGGNVEVRISIVPASQPCVRMLLFFMLLIR